MFCDDDELKIMIFVKIKDDVLKKRWRWCS